MPAILALTISASAALVRAAAAFAVRASRSLKRIAAGIKNRHDAMRLAELDDRMLADIGLNRSDLRDAFAELPWRDPSEVLARRAAERRRSRRLSRFSAPRAHRCCSGAPAALLPADRPAGPHAGVNEFAALAGPPIGQPSGAAVSPPALRMLRPPPPGGRILFGAVLRWRVTSANRDSPSRRRACY